MVQIIIIKKIVPILSFLIFIFNVNLVSAHQPFEIMPDLVSETSIDLSDATVSHAFYGEFFSENEEVIFNLNNLSGSQLDISILIPDKQPENETSKDLFPEIYLRSESGDQVFFSNQRSDFYEPFSRMNLVRIFDYKKDKFFDNEAVVKIKSNAAMRYVFSVGYKEIFSKRYAYGDTKQFNSNAQQLWYTKTDIYTQNSNIEKENQSGKEIFYAVIFIFVIVLIYGLFLFRNQLFSIIKR